MTVGEPDQPGLQDPSLLRPYMRAGGGWTEPESELAEQNEPPVASGVRPYLLTGGRTGPVNGTLEIEAQMATTALGRAILERLAFEQHDIVLLCQQPTAVAEIAAQLNLHLGVARVIVGDLLTSGYLSARRPEVGLHRNVPIIERVIRGLQAIR
ncbi:MAG: DUF742 domain-containing protein [Micromonosporaceae bacterium]|nr:DUF742 domain-containing protein [Micromonosporaceae bacterium]